jgi:YegS/Rv2252/BmrU family lipid kinase
LNVSLVVNPVAGNRALRSHQKIIDLLKEKVSLSHFATQKKGDALAYAREKTDIDRMVVAGGDGTMNEVINGLLLSSDFHAGREAPPIGLIPLGTSNVLARELGIPLKIDEAVHRALTGTPKKISLGKINGRYFSLMAGIGFDGETVFRVREGIKKISGKGAYLLSGIQTLMRYNPSLIQVTTAKETFSGFTVVVGKAHYYGGGFQITPKADITEPLLDVCILKSRTKKKLLRFISGVITKRHLALDDVVYRRVAKVTVTSRDTVYVQTDGDYCGTLPATIEVFRDAVSIIC